MMNTRKELRRWFDEHSAELELQLEEKIYDLQKETERSSNYAEIVVMIGRIEEYQHLLNEFKNHSPVRHGEINQEFLSYWLYYADKVEGIIKEE